MQKYKNPWHNPRLIHTGPQFYEPHPSSPTFEYCGHQVIERIPRVWDVVKDGVCVTQRAGKNGAKQAIDAIMAPQEIGN